MSTPEPLVPEAADAVLIEAEEMCNFVHDRTTDLSRQLLPGPAGAHQGSTEYGDVIGKRIAVIV